MGPENNKYIRKRWKLASTTMIKYTPRKILVTGSSGLIGSSITKYANSHNIKVLTHSRRINEIIETDKKLESVYYDLRNAQEITLDTDIDTVIHTATSNENSLKSLSCALENTFIGTQNLLKKCIENGIQKFVYISTVQLYSQTKNITDESSEINFKSIYTKQHYLTEQLLRIYASEFREGINILRVANVFSDSAYALSKRDNLVPTCFIKNGFDSNKIILNTNGQQRRNFIHDSSVGKICIKTLTKDGPILKIINVASRYSPSILDIAKMVQLEFLNYGHNREIELCTNEIAEIYTPNFTTQYYDQPSMLGQKELMEKSVKKLIKIEDLQNR
jgi:nucleoside-diphosphate-sugar epimerase